MPSYDYQCEECGYKFEAFHSMSAELLINCPECHQPKLIKLIGMGACVIVKGTQTPCYGGRSVKHKQSSDSKLGSKSGNKTKVTPWWRENRPLNKAVLNNSEQYIHTGETTKS